VPEPSADEVVYDGWLAARGRPSALSAGTLAQVRSALAAARVANERLIELEDQVTDERERRDAHIREAVDFGGKVGTVSMAVGLSRPSVYRILGSP